MLVFFIKQVNHQTLNLCEAFTSPIHSYINYKNIAWGSTNKTKLKQLFGKQKQAARIIFNKGRFMDARAILATLNALNVYQINLLQVEDKQKIKTNSSSRIFLHQLQIILLSAK